MDKKLLIEKNIKEFFPPKWTKKEIVVLAGASRFDVDVIALNNNLNNPIRDFVLRGGKRIRPTLFMVALKALGMKTPDKYIGIASAIELVHNGTLVLDDIEDNGILRRGEPTCHVRFGLDTATNVGFAMHVLPLKIIELSTKDLSDSQKIRIYQIYSEELINVAFGQSLDIYWHKNHSVGIDINKYLEMVRLKTGSLMRMSIRMACAVADTDQKTENSLRSFAENIGIAFQIIDDCLDLEPEADFGKSFGNDITEGKISLPVIYALKLAKRSQKAILVEILGKHSRNKRLIKKAVNIILETGALVRARKYATDLVQESQEDLKSSLSSNYNANELVQISSFLVTRDH